MWPFIPRLLFFSHEVVFNSRWCFNRVVHAVKFFKCYFLVEKKVDGSSHVELKPLRIEEETGSIRWKKSESFSPIEETLSLYSLLWRKTKILIAYIVVSVEFILPDLAPDFRLGSCQKFMLQLLCIPLLNSVISPKLKLCTANIILISTFLNPFLVAPGCMLVSDGSFLLFTVQLMMLFLKEMLQLRNSADRFKIKHMLKEPIENWSS